MSQSQSQQQPPPACVAPEKLGNIISDENYYYIGVQGSPFANDTDVFGLNSDEISALVKRFPNSNDQVMNGYRIKVAAVLSMGTSSTYGTSEIY
ncbi:hypothetical protein KM043_014601 [Ampulex compressa]|nr:hypothetical protein KM043_014601 [Ampulex compressa]